MKSYQLRNIPPELWIKAKIRVATDQELKSLRELVLKAIEEYLEPKGDQARWIFN